MYCVQLGISYFSKFAAAKLLKSLGFTQADTTYGSD